MHPTVSSRLRTSIALAAIATFTAACASESPVQPRPTLQPELTAAHAATIQSDLATLRRVTARYHDLEAAIADGFVLLHPCESRPDEGPVGIVYVHFGRLLDGVIDPQSPDALIYEPGKRPKLVGVEFALPYSMWTEAEPPQWHGATFQPEDEFGVWALHAWVWRSNPEGMFAESHPRVTCQE